ALALRAGRPENCALRGVIWRCERHITPPHTLNSIVELSPFAARAEACHELPLDARAAAEHQQEPGLAKQPLGMVPEDDGPAPVVCDERGSGLHCERGGRSAGGGHGLGGATVKCGAAGLELAVERRWPDEPATA